MTRNLLLKALTFLALTFYAQNAISQAASASWTLISSGNAITTGNIAGSAVSAGSSNGSLSYGAAGVVTDGWFNFWGNSRITTAYYQYTISPAGGSSMYVNSLTFNHSSTNSSLTGAVYYSLNNFSSSTQLESNFSVSENETGQSYTPNIFIPEGSTLTVRIYAWHNAWFSTRNFRNRNVVISGTTCSAVSVTTNPATQNICQGSSLNLNSGFSNATAYQWYRNGVALTGATSPTYVKANATPTDSGLYHVTGSNECGLSAQSAGAMISVSPVPVLNPSAASPAVCLGSSTVLSANATMASGAASAENQTDFSIPDNNLNTGVSSVISVPATCASATDIAGVQVSITHANNAHLDIYLVSPNGDQIALSTDKGGTGDNYNATFVTGGAALPTGNSTVSGNRAPQEPFSNLSGNASGNWTLRVYDDTSGTTGTLTGWSINLANATCGNITYAWTPAGSLTGANTATPTATPTTDTTYTVLATAGGCSTQGTVQVTVNAPAGGTLSGALDSCGATTGTLMLSGHSGTIVGWESSLDNFATGPTTIVNTASSYNFSGLTQTTYFRVVLQIGSCQSYSSVATVAPGTTTTWNGSAWSNGIPNASTSVIFSGNYSEPDHVRACNVTVTNNSDVVIPSGYSLEVNGNLVVDAGSTLSFENNANLMQTSNVANTSPITIFRNSSALMRNDYTLWSSPVQGQGLLAFSPLTVTSPTTRFYTYTTATNLYSQVTNISTAQFEGTTGYLIRMPNTHPTTPTVWQGEFNGVPHNGPYTHTMTNLGVGQSFNLVGNPYPSPIDVATFVQDNATAITGTLYFWRKTNNAASPSYCSWTAGTFVDNGENQVIDPQGVVRTGQGFFVEALPGQTQLQFNNGQRYDDNTDQFFRPAQVQKDRIWLNLTSASGNFSQTAIVYVEGGNSAGVDMFDGRYINDGAIQLVQKIGGVDYAVQGREAFTSTDVVPLSFTANAAGSFTIAIDHVDGLFLGDQPIYLKDNVAGVTYDIKSNPYTFASEPGSFDNRFELVYQNALSTGQPALDQSAVAVYKANGGFVVDAGAIVLDNVQAYDLRGRLIAQKTDINNTATTVPCDQSNQVLVLKITDLQGRVVNKKVLN